MLPSLSITELMFTLFFLHEVPCKLRACKNARNIKETQNSSRVVSHLCIAFCEPTKQHSLPWGINFIDFLHINRPFLKTAVSLKGRSTEFRSTDFLHAESHRIDFKWVTADQLRTLLISSEKKKKKKRKKPCASKVWLKIFHYSTMLSPHCWCFLCSQQLSSKPSALTVSEYLLHFAAPRNPHHSTGTHYARWYLNTSSKCTPTKKQTQTMHIHTHKTHACPKQLTSFKDTIPLSASMFLWRTWVESSFITQLRN